MAHNFFAQDTWRVKKNLTVNYGTPYEIFSPQLYHQNASSNFTPANAYNYRLERSFSLFDTTRRFVGNVVWNLPIGKGGLLLNSDGLASRLIGGWQLNSIVTLQTGTPFTVSAQDQSQTGRQHSSRRECALQPLTVAPAIGVAIAPRAGIVPLESKSFPVTGVVHNNVKGRAQGTLNRIAGGSAWRLSPFSPI